jgi:putative addiction module killer protein
MDYNCSVKQIVTTEVFDDWFAALRDKHGKARIQARIDRTQLGNFGDCEPVGEGVSEMRIHHGPGYRVYFVQRGLEVVILLAGGDKSSQTKDIKLALEMARSL